MADPIKEDPKEKYRSLKAFSKISNIIYGFIMTIIIGIVAGYFLDKYVEGVNWMLICIIVFFVIGIFNFYRALLRYKEWKNLKLKEALSFMFGYML